MAKSNKTKRNKTLAVILLVVLAALYFFAPDEFLQAFSPDTAPQRRDDAVVVYALDVGQGDAFLLLSPGGKTMLIDTGEAGYFSVIADELAALGIASLDVVVATHPHSDHIGSMAKIIETYPIGSFYLPDATHTSTTFSRMIQNLEDNDVPTHQAVGGLVIPWDEDVDVTILSPLKGGTYPDLNNVSAMLRVSYRNTSMLFTGDAEAPAEDQLLSAYAPDELHADVLKLGHHGSSTSTSRAFLTAVSPKYAVVSLGKDNSYGHPHRETLKLLKEFGIPLYRTDTMGKVTVTLDGQTVSITAQRNAHKAA